MHFLIWVAIYHDCTLSFISNIKDSQLFARLVWFPNAELLSKLEDGRVVAFTDFKILCLSKFENVGGLSVWHALSLVNSSMLLIIVFVGVPCCVTWPFKLKQLFFFFLFFGNIFWFIFFIWVIYIWWLIYDGWIWIGLRIISSDLNPDWLFWVFWFFLNFLNMVITNYRLFNKINRRVISRTISSILRINRRQESFFKAFTRNGGSDGSREE